MVLVIDDYPPMGHVLKKLLATYGIPVQCVYSAAEAWEVLRGIPPDVILLDDAMPGKNGLQMLDEIKSTPTLAHIPVVMYSAGDDPVRIAQAIEHGAVHWFVKATTPWDHLLGTLQELHAPPA